MSSFFNRFVSQHIKTGNLSIIYPSGRSASFGDGTGVPIVLRIKTFRTIWALATNPELAFGEAFMDGRIILEQGDIYHFLELVFRNTSVYSLKGAAKINRWLAGLCRRFDQYNPVGRAKENVAHHYDLDGSLYRLFLDIDSQYSCAYFETPDASLEEAQLAKKRHLAAKLLIDPGHEVLDIGSGWGGLGLYLAEITGANVTGVTLSEEQFAISNERAQSRNLANRTRFHLKDYRHLDEQFDRIVSVGMFEHVGVGHYDEFFSQVRSRLKPNGVMVLHSIGVSDGPSHTNPWIHKYIFPGGYIPALSEVLPAIERQGLVVCDIEILRLHYAETLKAWRDRFMSRREEAVSLYDERFARMWEFYLAASESTFRYQGMMVFQIQLSLDKTVVPLQRDYIQAAETRLRGMEASILAPSRRASE